MGVVANQIKNALINNGRMTDRQLAEYIARPYPSVRRTRSRMEDQNIIEAVVDMNGDTSTPIQWQVASSARN